MEAELLWRWTFFFSFDFAELFHVAVTNGRVEPTATLEPIWSRKGNTLLQTAATQSFSFVATDQYYIDVHVYV